jgi:hypothetical protein
VTQAHDVDVSAVLDLEVRRLEVEARKRIVDLRGLCRRRPEEAR